MVGDAEVERYDPFAVLQFDEIIPTKAPGEIDCNQSDIDIEQQIDTSCEQLSSLSRPDHGFTHGEVLVGPGILCLRMTMLLRSNHRTRLSGRLMRI
ncbi:hypothetical protein Nepgr_003899 [Nepenthes gracilis]|uniref:Uncharacterized protein n=1 Tax=Nepenthes gracilis TaxID=150966 RepID=A0AAD3S0D7_NEPGR|nr:hypothetical protein Nepgr_003899 [Nepenthes gracilis]